MREKNRVRLPPSSLKRNYYLVTPALKFQSICYFLLVETGKHFMATNDNYVQVGNFEKIQEEV